jgi:hypothetical protein
MTPISPVGPIGPVGPVGPNLDSEHVRLAKYEL